ncbi:hypothetical protein [Methanolobus psychrotolerans]|nr:hypothetical protein [Methanolobus psychrotolerans]
MVVGNRVLVAVVFVSALIFGLVVRDCAACGVWLFCICMFVEHTLIID